MRVRQQHSADYHDAHIMRQFKHISAHCTVPALMTRSKPEAQIRAEVNDDMPS